MSSLLKALIKQPYWIIALVLGAVLVALPYVTIDKENHLKPVSPSSHLPAVVGICLLALSAAAFGYGVLVKPAKDEADGGGLDLASVKEYRGVFSTVVSGCDIRVVTGRIEEYPAQPGTALVLPCNEYFDDECAADTNSALGAYVSRVFDGQIEAFKSLVKEQRESVLGPGVPRQKTERTSAESFGVGRCLLLANPLGRSVPVALVSTTTQRAGRGCRPESPICFPECASSSIGWRMSAV